MSGAPRARARARSQMRGEAPAAQILHQRHAGTEAERAGEVKARYPGHLRHAALRELFVEVRFDVPEGATERSNAGRHAVRLR